MTSVLQPWVENLSMMQQTVLIEMARGPDGLTKYHRSKFLLRWFRRCILFSAFDKRVLTTPCEAGGGSFTGPSFELAEGTDSNKFTWELGMTNILNEYIRQADEVPHHAYRHMMHAFEIVGYKHPDERIRAWWNMAYNRLAKDMHLSPETEEQLDKRLGDTREGWLASADEATLA